MNKILLFDADGTLFDFIAAEKNALNLLFDYCGIEDKKSALPVYHRINKALWKQIEQGTLTQNQLKIKRFEEFKAEMNLDIQPEQMAEVFMSELSNGTQLIEHAYETLEILSKEYDCHIVTNGITRIQKGRLSKSELRPLIKELFISEEMGASKPDPKYFEIVKNKLNPKTDDELIVIGDSLSSDIKGALNSHLKCIWYNPDHQKAPDFHIDAIIDDLRQLPEIIKSL